MEVEIAVRDRTLAMVGVFAAALRARIAIVATSSYNPIMTSVGIRELKNNLSRYLRKVEAGERIAVTDRGRVVAELGKPLSGEASANRSRYAELVASGLARPPTEAGDPLADWPPIRLRRGTAAALLDEDRGER